MTQHPIQTAICRLLEQRAATNNLEGQLDRATREDVKEICATFRRLAWSHSVFLKLHNELARIRRWENSGVADYDESISPDSPAASSAVLKLNFEADRKRILTLEQSCDKEHLAFIAIWAESERLADRVLYTARIEKFHGSEDIGEACEKADLFAQNPFAKGADGWTLQVIKTLKGFVPNMVAQTIPAVTMQQTIVLWEGADNTPYNRRIALTCSAYLEANRNVGKAIAALKREGHKVSQSTFYEYLGVRDEQDKGWRNGIISEQVGKLENGVSPRYNGKQAVPKG